ncbi:hypothetical protein [Acinetobacter pseudolwoffii]|uniref:hypothetical protein n=1 Tax=Acinetobacter pseudolwoffii TaxID=2053287 RepID=UPI00209A8BF0|nr:hypothetical protein [Acinetobacter pseudolwoffii]MCO8089803.1 hypothetical protein [Acinetobacter pseudolwoffii]
MQTMTKIAFISASVLSMGALTACQSTSNVPNNEHRHMMKHHEGKKQHLTPEQREQFKAKRAERMQFAKQLQQACDNKAVGSAIQVKSGDKTIDGTCKMVFKADHKEMKSHRGEHRGMKAEHHPMRADMRRGMMHGEVLTDAKRAELTKQFDQRLAQRQAHQQAMLQACQGKKDGTAVQIKVGEQTVNGKCLVRFQPKAPAY